MKTPMLDKMLEVKDESQAIGEFLEWLTSERKIHLGKYLGDEEYESDANKRERTDEMHRVRDHYVYSQEDLVPVNLDIEELLAEYFGIDSKQAEKERREILEGLKHK